MHNITRKLSIPEMTVVGCGARLTGLQVKQTICIHTISMSLDSKLLT